MNNVTSGPPRVRTEAEREADRKAARKAIYDALWEGTNVIPRDEWERLVLGTFNEIQSDWD